MLAKTGIDLSEGGGFPEILKFQEHFREYKITVYQGLACVVIMFEGQVDAWEPHDSFGNHECNKRYCEICNQKRDVGHLFYDRL
jgi:hypothetical protein